MTSPSLKKKSPVGPVPALRQITHGTGPSLKMKSPVGPVPALRKNQAWDRSQPEERIARGTGPSLQKKINHGTGPNPKKKITMGSIPNTDGDFTL